jgi:hypothetical protein
MSLGDAEVPGATMFGSSVAWLGCVDPTAFSKRTKILLVFDSCYNPNGPLE